MNTKPNYFESEVEGQTPSNTPSNKQKGQIKYDLNNMNFNKIQNQEEEVNESENTHFCASILLGKLPQGYCKDNDKCCSKLYCNRCQNKVSIVHGFKFKESSDTSKIINECLEKDDNFNSYNCKCCKVSISEEVKNLSEFNFDWECDGHFIH